MENEIEFECPCQCKHKEGKPPEYETEEERLVDETIYFDSSDEE